MSDKVVMRDLERRIYLFYTEDGLLEASVGLVIAGFAALLFFGLPMFTGILGLVPLLIWYIGKRFITEPRTGIIRPGRRIERKLKGFFLTMAILGMGILFLFLVMRTAGPLSGAQTLVMFALVLSLGISTLGLVMQESRFYVHALVVFILFTFGALLNPLVVTVDTFLLGVFLSGSAILVCGMAILFRFLKRYPVVGEGISS